MGESPKEKELSFEESFRELEAIVASLESGRGELEESLANYERGIRLLRECRQKLEGASRRIELLKGIDEQGDPILTPIDENSLRSQNDVAGRQTPSSKSTNVAPNSANATERVSPDLRGSASRPNINGDAERKRPARREAPARGRTNEPTRANGVVTRRVEPDRRVATEPGVYPRNLFDGDGRTWDEPPF